MIKKELTGLFLGLVFIIGCVAFYYKDMFIRLYEGYKISRVSRADYYRLDDGLSMQDITQKLIEDTSIPNSLKKPLSDGTRRIIIFKYPSDGVDVAGYLSYLTEGNQPTIVFLRGGNGFFGIMRPNNQYSFIKGYNIIGTLYRGNIYEGIDEFGGKDVVDVENLIKFLPELKKFTGKDLRIPFAMMGLSRGAMQMFNALSSSELLKENITHAISVSGNIDLEHMSKTRPEMRYLLNKKFKESGGRNFDEWLAQRNPVSRAKSLSKTLKILLIYGALDNRVSLDEQKNFQASLAKVGISSELAVLPQANHGMEGHFEELEKRILEFLK